ncbi:hypothetical protein HDU92_007305 [Lobulomyces angularis]|nr:hypothetical protein HDU92_007305 [Lobulomyces angularis]
MKKITNACDRCRLRKRKCDGFKPCATCIKVNYTCTFDIEKSKRGPKSKINDALLNKIDRLEKALAEKASLKNSSNHEEISNKENTQVVSLQKNIDLDILEKMLLTEEDDSQLYFLKNFNSNLSFLDLDSSYNLPLNFKNLNAPVVMDNSNSLLLDNSDLSSNGSPIQSSFSSPPSFTSSTPELSSLFEPDVAESAKFNVLLNFMPFVTMLPFWNEEEFKSRISQGIHSQHIFGKTVPFPAYLIDALLGLMVFITKISFDPQFTERIDCALHYVNKAEQSLESLKDDEADRTDALYTRVLLSLMWLHLGKYHIASKHFIAIYSLAQEYNWDRPTVIKPKYLKTSHPEERKDRCIICLLGDENDNFWMLDSKSWEQLGIPNDHTDTNWHFNLNADRISTFMQAIFLLRDCIKFCYRDTTLRSSSNSLSVVVGSMNKRNITDLHNSLIDWLHEVSSIYKSFDSLADFLQGTVILPRRKWIIQYSNLQLSFIFLHSLTKLHEHNNERGKSFYRFKISNKVKIQGSSLDIILLICRAFVSILQISLPNINDSDYTEFQGYFNSISLDLLVIGTVVNIVTILIKTLKSELGWAGNSIHRKEVSFYLGNIFLKVIKLHYTNNPKSKFKSSELEKLILDTTNKIDVEEKINEFF